MLDIDGDPNQKPSHRLDRPTLNTWIFGLIVFLTVEACALGIVVLIWMIDSGYLFK